MEITSKERKFPAFFCGIAAVIMIFGSTSAYAYQIESLKDVPLENDFVLAGSKVEVWLNPGESYVKELMITNRLGKKMDFKVSVEDFEGTKDLESPTRLLGDDRGPYSLKDYISTELNEFTLDHGQRMILPVTINIPADAEPGGRYGSVLISANPTSDESGVEKDSAKGKINLITRLASLFFVGVNGDIYRDGRLSEFKTSSWYYEQAPVSLQLIFENNGRIHLSPYGVIEIYNMMGRKIDEVEADPWFSMPDSLRFREIKWNRNFLFGRYTAKASINRGYSGIVDVKEVSFWVIPWKIILAALAILILIISILRWIASHFEIKAKKRR